MPHCLGHFNLDRHINRRQTFKTQRDAALLEWRQLLAAWPVSHPMLLETGSLETDRTSKMASFRGWSTTKRGTRSCCVVVGAH